MFPNIRKYFRFGSDWHLPIDHMTFISDERKYTKFFSNLYNLQGGNYQLCRTLQSWRYFIEYEYNIRHTFQIKNTIRERSSIYIEPIKDKQSKDEATPVVGIHVRRGDFLDKHKYVADIVILLLF